MSHGEEAAPVEAPANRPAPIVVGTPPVVTPSATPRDATYHRDRGVVLAVGVVAFVVAIAIALVAIWRAYTPVADNVRVGDTNLSLGTIAVLLLFSAACLRIRFTLPGQLPGWGRAPAGPKGEEP